MLVSKMFINSHYCDVVLINLKATGKMTTCKGQEHVACTLRIYLFECADYKNTNVYKFAN